MASEIKRRSPYIPKIARALGLSTEHVRDHLKEARYFAPWLDEEKILKTLESRGISTAKYRANGQSHQEAPKNSEAPKNKANRTLAVERARAEKYAIASKRRLISKLARLLPEGDSQYGKQQARVILLKGKYKRPKGGWTDEPRALQIFKDAGISIDNFEYATAQEGSSAAPASPSPPSPPISTEPLTDAQRIEHLASQIQSLTQRNTDLNAQLTDALNQLQDRVAEIKEVKDILIGYESTIFKLIRANELHVWPEPLGRPIDALNIVRSTSLHELIRTRK